MTDAPNAAALLASARARLGRAEHEIHDAFGDLVLDAVTGIADASDLLLADVRALQDAQSRTPGIDTGPGSELLFSARQVCAQHGFPGAGGGIALAAWLQQQFAELAAARACAEATDALTAERCLDKHNGEQHAADHSAPQLNAGALSGEQQTLDTAFEAACFRPLARLVYAEVCEAGDILRGVAAAFDARPELQPFAADVLALHRALENVGIRAIESVAKESEHV